MFLVIKNNDTNLEELALIAKNGVRIYNVEDSSGEADRTISNEEFLNNYEILGTLLEEEVLEGEYGDTFEKIFEYTHPKTEKGYFDLVDKIDDISKECLDKTAELFGIKIIELESYQLIKELSEANLKNIKEYFGVDTDIQNPES